MAVTLISPSFADVVNPEPDPPPVVGGSGQAGYDLITGSFSYSATEVVIGDPDAGGLKFSRIFFGAGWRDNYAGTINSSSNTYTVSIGSDSESFTLSGGVFISDQAMGSTLTVSGSTYTYTLRDGTVVLFDTTLANGGSVYDANVARITTVTQPSGDQIVWHYKSVTVQSVAAMRLQSVTNNLGYQLHFDYSLSNPTLSSQLTAWKTLTKVTGINNAVDYCNPTADTCPSFTVTWPSATYGTSGGFSTVADNLGNITRYSASVNGLIGIRRPTSPSANSLTISYSVDGLLSQVSNAVGTWTYSYAHSGGQRTTTVTDPLGHTRAIVSDVAELEIISDTNGTSNTTSYQYDTFHRVTRVIMPEGNYTQYTYDERGNITETRMVDKPTSSLADIVTTASFDTTCTCNQPNSTTDARGFRTDYTYDSMHGGLLTVMQPAPSGAAPIGLGARPETRYQYEQKTARYYTSPGNTDPGSPVYRLTQVRACASGSWSGSACANGAAVETRTAIAYPAAGLPNNLLPTQVTRGAGDSSLAATVATIYDPVGNIFTVDGPLSGPDDTTRYRFDAGRQLVGVVGPDPDGGALKNRAIRNTYNADGQITSVEQGTVNSQSDPDWSTFAALLQRTTIYNAQGRVTRETLVGGGATQSVVEHAYDNAGRRDCTATRMNPATFVSPAAACTLTLVAQGLGPDRVTRNTYDNANRLTKVTQGYGSIVAPDTVDSETIAFDLQFARGVRFELTPPDDGGVRAFRIHGCGSVANATHTQRIAADGFVLVAYETDDSKQNRMSCGVNIILRLTCDRFAAPRANSWSVSVIFNRGRFYVLNEEPELRCEA